MSEWVLHCAVNQRHIRRSQPTREAALKDACSQLLQGHDDIAAETEPSTMGTKLDIAATDHIRPTATTTAIPTVQARICAPSTSR
jgi:hypothetical protein